MLSSYFELNGFEWVIFILALLLIAGLLYLVPISLALTRPKTQTEEDSKQETAE